MVQYKNGLVEGGEMEEQVEGGWIKEEIKKEERRKKRRREGARRKKREGERREEVEEGGGGGWEIEDGRSKKKGRGRRGRAG